MRQTWQSARTCRISSINLGTGYQRIHMKPRVRPKLSNLFPSQPSLRPRAFCRYNANRAALVQSRIKALEKLEVVDPPEDDTQFRFHLPIPEPLGRPVINIESVSFGYPKRGPGSVEDEGDGKRKKKEKQAGEEEAEDQHSENDKAEPVVPKVPAEIGKVLFENVDFGVDLETRIGEDEVREGRRDQCNHDYEPRLRPSRCRALLFRISPAYGP